MKRSVLLGAGVLGVSGWGVAALGQVAPERLYFGRDRAVPVVVTVPEGREGQAALRVLEGGTWRELESAPAKAGVVNLATVLPSIWSAGGLGSGAAPAGGEGAPPALPRTVYVQLVVGDEAVGPAMVVQPMLTPTYAQVVRPPQWAFVPPPQPTYSGVRAYVDKDVLLVTSAGEVRVRLRPDVAPNTAWNFRELVEGGFYTGVIFHRVVAANPAGHPFVIQGGDPTGQGTGGPGYNLDLEPSTLPHDFGVISMARSGDPNSAGSQFFLCLSREGTAFLDGQYTSFGQTIAGADVITAIAATPVTPPGPQGRDRPVDPPVIEEARLVDAAPAGTGPAPVTRPGLTPPAER